MIEHDARRKLESLDYSRIRFFAANCDFTIRELANTYGVSTKFVKKILQAQVILKDEGNTRFIMTDSVTPQLERILCSGCLMAFGSRSGLMLHYEIWSSGGTKELECVNAMPQLTTR